MQNLLACKFLVLFLATTNSSKKLSLFKCGHFEMYTSSNPDPLFLTAVFLLFTSVLGSDILNFLVSAINNVYFIITHTNTQTNSN